MIDTLLTAVVPDETVFITISMLVLAYLWYVLIEFFFEMRQVNSEA